ncbi:MAG: radical SAM protein [Candidatus Jordarchaeaceae archaeon]
MKEGISEINVIRKDFRKVDIRFALAYPSEYQVGMSCLGFHTLYAMLNSRPDVACERVFNSWNTPPFSIESRQPLKNFDVVGFSLQFETDYTNVLRMISNTGIPLCSRDRNKNHPLIIAGGPCALENPKPLSEYVDLFLLGDAEPVIDDLLDTYLEGNLSRQNLETLSELPGIYVPQFSKEPVKKIWCKSLKEAYRPVTQVIPQVEDNNPLMPVFGKTLLLEIARGCEWGCRFCLIGYTGRPMRNLDLKTALSTIEEGVERSSVRKVTLIAPSLSRYKDLVELSWSIVNLGLELSVSSLRVDNISDELIEALAIGGQRTATLAPEAGTERLRETQNKGFRDDEIFSAAEMICEKLQNLKMYFILGLPTEEKADLDGIVNLVSRIGALGFPSQGVRLSINPFVPKPHTPFMWEPQPPIEYFREGLKFISSELRGNPRISIEGLDPRWGVIEALLSLGDNSLGKAIELSSLYGGGLGAWRRALKETKISIREIVGAERNPEAEYPWNIVDVGVRKEFLLAERDKAYEGKMTPPCSIKCSKCGLNCE